MGFNRVVDLIYSNQLWQMLQKTDEHLLSKMVQEGFSVLDVGCGSSPPLLRVSKPRRYIGVDAHGPSLSRLHQSGLLQDIDQVELIQVPIQELSFEAQSVDVVLLIDVLEHLKKEDGENLLLNSVRWSRKFVYVATPNGFLKQDPYDSNGFQEHLSGWTTNELRAFGFSRFVGGGGPKFLRRNEMQPEQWSHASGSSMRWRPKILWSFVANIAQVFTFCLPKISYQLRCVRWTREVEL